MVGAKIMILVVDVGNTNITYGVFKGDKLVSSLTITLFLKKYF